MKSLGVFIVVWFVASITLIRLRASNKVLRIDCTVALIPAIGAAIFFAV